MIELVLERRWRLGEEIGSGGFGRVYVAEADDGFVGVAKLVPKTPGSDRELLFEDLEGVRNVVPILESGDVDDHWVLIMPRADGSLRQHTTQRARPLDADEVVTILQDVVAALVDLDGRVVHRDLKPANVLLLEDRWCLADFGIARYAEASTAPDTQKFAWSPPYAAPERWRHEHATNACDVYALGVMIYEMLRGELPFAGPGWDEFRDQHLHQDPPRLNVQSDALETLVTECLMKAPQARPQPSTMARRLETGFRPVTEAAARLRAANLEAVDRASQRAAAESAQRTEADRRSALMSAAQTTLESISTSLREQLFEAASAATPERRHGGWSLELNEALFAFDGPNNTADDPWQGWAPAAFDVIAHGALGIRIPPGRDEYEGRSHSLWYCDCREAGQYAWYETAFMISPLVPRRRPQDPFALPPGEESAKAVGSGIAELQVAWPFSPVRPGELDEFVERWTVWFADAATGRLQHPRSMPEQDPAGSWRR